MSSSVTSPLIIAHRGSSAVAPENTLAAFSRALDDGAEGVEFDVRITRDGIPVVFHDSDLKRIAGSEVRIDALTAAELADVDVGGWFNKNFEEHAKKDYSGEAIPTLESVMELLGALRGPVYVELKSVPGRSVQFSAAVGETLRKYADSHSLIVKSFDFEIVPMVKKMCPGIKTAALFEPNFLRLFGDENRLITFAGDIFADRLSIHHALATESLTKKAAEADLPVTVWTVDSPDWLERSRLLGVDSLITNNPGLLLSARVN